MRAAGFCLLAELSISTAQSEGERIARAHSLSKYSSGTSSSGTSCVRTSRGSSLSASSTPITASASNAFPSSTNSSTLSELTVSDRDRPCRSPDCSPERDTGPSPKNSAAPARGFPLRACFLPDVFFLAALFADTLRFAVFLDLFAGFDFLVALFFGLIDFFFVFLWRVIGAV